MDGVHDLGGKLGFGPIEVADEGSPFHGAWEGRMMGIARAISRPPDWNIDKFRHSRELEAPVLYLTRPYYDQWYKAYACMLVGSGVVTLVNVGAKLVHPGGAKLVHLTLCGTRCWGVVPVVHRRDPRCFV